MINTMKKPDHIKQEAATLKKLWQEAKAKDKSLTQARLADLCGYENPVVVNQYLNGYIPLNLTALLKFSAALKFKPEQVSPRLATLIHQEISQIPTDTFKVRIDSISMVPDFLMNDEALINPAIEPKTGDFIAVKTEENQILIRKLHKEGDSLYLMATNPAWPEKISPLADKSAIIGRVMQRITTY